MGDRQAEASLSRLYLIVGGAIVIALFAALIAPWFVNWDNYRTSFEQEASRILGHPVHVAGSARATILPSPSLTFTDVRVGEDGETPMMTVDRFDVTIELLPLIQGQVHVVSMTLERPDVHVTADSSGALDWLDRPSTADAIQPDRFSLADVEIRDGTLTYADSAAGIALSFAHVTATIDTPSLAGPWHVDGSYLDEGEAVQFRIATGRQLADRSIRIKTDFSPARMPFGVTADGVLGVDASTGLTYKGTYSLTEVADATAQSEAGAAVAADTAPGWRSEGSYALSREGLVIDKAVLSNGPADRATSLAGSLSVRFGATPSFDAVAESTQLDFDRTFGGGPNAPVNVAQGANDLVGWLSSLPKPTIPGHIRFSVPAVVAGGAVIQNVGFEASPAAEGWQLKGFHALLPGEANLTADGLFTTAKSPGFTGDVHLAVGGPSTFAAWWRGRSGSAGIQPLAAFDISGKAEIAPRGVRVSGIDARIGGATISGNFAWSAGSGNSGRELGATLQADRIDLAQVKALADLLVGRDLSDVRALADSYTVDLTAGSFQYQDVLLKGVKINARYAEDVLNVVSFTIDDLGGASFKVTSGRIDGLSTPHPRGRLDAHLEVHDFDGLAAIAAKVAPGTGLFEWIGRTAPAITPTVIDAHVIAPPTPGGSGIRVALEGVAGPTTVGVTVQTGKEIANWRSADTTFDLSLESPDSAALALLLGFTAKAPENDAGGQIKVHGEGVPDAGVDTTLDGEFAGLSGTSTGKLTVGADGKAAFDGTFGLNADDLDPFIATAGLAIPGAATGTKLDLGGHVDVADGAASLTWRNGIVGDRAVSGALTLARGADQSWQVDGDLSVDAVDLNWLMSVSLGFAPVPTGDPDTPWSKTPFGPPTYGAVSGKIAVAADHFFVGDDVDVANAKVTVDVKPHNIEATLADGHLAGGTAGGALSIANVEGDANLRASFELHGAALESFVWQRDGRSVATGILDLSGSFEATGRSPAALVSSATGGGVIDIRDGEARYINPNTARLIVRASDLGQEYSDTELEKTLSDEIDADSLKFDEAGAPFSIAAGAVRVKDMAVRSPGLEASGDTVIDLNSLTIDSDWTLKFDPGDSKVQGTDPKLGLIFRGPLGAPSRQIDALPFSSYLNTRRAARMLEIIATEEADRAERERLGRLVVKLKQDHDRVVRIAAAAAERERRRAEIAAAAMRKIVDAHIAAEAAADQRAADALQRAVDRAVAAEEAAQKAAADATARATAERGRAVAAQAALNAAVEDEKRARAALAEGTRALAAAQQASDEVTATAAADLKAADTAEKIALDARSAESADREALTKARTDYDDANQALEDATARATAADKAAGEAAAAAAAARAALLEADRALAEARDASAKAAAAANAAEIALAAATEGAKQAAAEERATAAAAAEAVKARAAREAEAATAATDARSAAAEREAAQQALNIAEQEAKRFAAAHAAAEKLAEDAAAIAESQPPEAAQTGPDSAAAIASSTKRRAMASQAWADQANQKLVRARRDFAAAEASANDAAARANEAEAALAAAVTRVDETAAAAQRAAAANAAASATLADRTSARDAAVKRAAALKAAAEAAGTAFSDAQGRAGDAEARETETAQEAEAADTERFAAARHLAGAISARNAAAFALTSASEAADTAIAEALRTRDVADASNAKSVNAASAVAGLDADNDTAATAADEAAKARAAAEQALAEAEARAADAEAAAARAADEVKARVADTVAAKRRAGMPVPDQAESEPNPPQEKAGAAKPPPPPARVARDRPIIISPPYQ